MTARSVFLMGALSTPGVAFAQNVVEVQVAPPSITLKVGEKSGLLATAFDRVGNVIPTVRIIWSSNNVGITLPTRSNAVARSPLFSPTLSVMEGGATCTSTTFWANATPGVESAAI